MWRTISCCFLGLTVLVTGTLPLMAKDVHVSEVQERIDRVVACLTTVVVEKDAPLPCKTLKQSMAESHVPGVSVAVIHDGGIEWATGFGVTEIGGAAVTAETLFQAGSISKPVAALAALHLVEKGRLSLDTDINLSLSSWKIPFNSAVPGAVVTLRELLTHTAGLTVHGFSGYAAGVPVPTLVQVLNGERPANTDPIILEASPGSHWKYSGGGYTVMQQLLIDTVHQPFPEFMHDTVLAPVGMTHSTYEQPLPVPLRSEAATPYNVDGSAVDGGFHTYPEMAAAGLWTTPTDLARFIIEIQRTLRGEASHVLSAETTQQMLSRGKGNWGLGLAIGGAHDNPYFAHSGSDVGFESMLVGYRNIGDGAVVMTNGQGGATLASAIMRSIASVYRWPDFQPIARTVVAVAPAELDAYVGRYVFTPTFSITVSNEHGQLISTATDQTRRTLFPESSTKFFAKEANVEYEFLKGENNLVDNLVLHLKLRDMRGTREP